MFGEQKSCEFGALSTQSPSQMSHTLHVHDTNACITSVASKHKPPQECEQATEEKH